MASIKSARARGRLISYELSAKLVRSTFSALAIHSSLKPAIEEAEASNDASCSTSGNPNPRESGATNCEDILDSTSLTSHRYASAISSKRVKRRLQSVAFKRIDSLMSPQNSSSRTILCNKQVDKQ